MAADFVVSIHSGDSQLTSWSQAVDPGPWLAVPDGVLRLHNAEGHNLMAQDLQSLERVCASKQITSLAWHPAKPVLVLASDKGSILCWHGTTHTCFEDAKTHHARVSILVWSTRQTAVLASGDEAGQIVLWRLETTASLSVLMHFDAAGQGSISHIVFAQEPDQTDSNRDLAAAYYAVGNPKGSDIHCADTAGHHSKLFSLESSGPLLGLFWYSSKHQLVSVSKTGDLYIHGEEEGHDSWQQLVTMKIGGGAAADGSALMVSWVRGQTLASASGRDGTVRMYDLDTEDNYILRIDEDVTSHLPTTISSLSYSAATATLAAGTVSGRVAMWRGPQADSPPGATSASPMHHLDTDPSLQWMPQRCIAVPGSVDRVLWSRDSSLLAVQTGTTLHICQRGVLQRRTCGSLAAAQLSSHEVAVEPLTGAATIKIKANLQVRGLSLSETHLLMSSNTAAELFDLTITPPQLALSMTGSQTPAPLLQGQLLFRAEGSSIEVCSMAGALEQTLTTSEDDGLPSLLEANKHFMFVLTDRSRLCIWSLAGREAKPYGVAGRAVDLPSDLTVMSMRCNCDGTKVSLLTKQAHSSQQPQAKELFVYDLQTGTISTCSFGDTAVTAAPQQHFWDAKHPLLLACELATGGSALGNRPAAAATAEESGLMVATMFATPQGMVLQDCSSLPPCQGLIAIRAPFLYTFDGRPEALKSGQRQVVQQAVMHTFVGMQDMDEQTSQALLEFSYHLAIGDTNEAYKAVKLVKSPGLWRGLCLSAIRSRRHQVVHFCLDNMEDAQCAQAARQFGAVPEPDARLGLVAVQLGEPEEAKKLFSSAGRSDLLNKLLQALGAWDEAVRLAEKSDSINVKATHFRYAQHLEAVGDYAAAIKHYQLSDTHRQEVPRMLYEAEQMSQLATYINDMQDPELLRWWGKYNESLGQLDTALQSYRQADDTVAIVRLHCQQEDFVAACNVVENSSNAAAAFMLARQLEATDQVAEAVHYFGKAKRNNHGMRLAKQHGMDAELLDLALKSSPLLMLDTAEYFEQRRELDKAVLLYQKAGKERRALELCFSANLLDMLASIASNLTAKSDPAVMARCADFFLEHGEHERGVQLLIQASKPSRALDVCHEHNITITESMAESLMPGQDVGVKEREGLLKRIAKLAKQQGSFQLACKKYTQAGEKVKALKCLIRSGNTDKIIFFAGVSRNAEIYTLAANYLQTLDWHSRPELTQSIVTFYTKAKAWDSLALFYEACAQIEIDEFRDYQKALQALQEGLKHVAKSQKPGKQALQGSLTRRIAATTAFLQAQQLFSSDAASAVQICNGLIVELSSASAAEGNVMEAGVRIGDVYALLVEYWASQGGMQQAHSLLERMRLTKVPPELYIEAATVEAVYKAAGQCST